MNLNISARHKGQGLVEYAFILVLIAVAVLLTITLLGQRINNVFANILIQMEYPGVYSGPAVSVSGVGVSADPDCLGGECDLAVSASANFDPPVTDPVCVRFSATGAGSKTVCGSPPAASFEGASDPGEVTACVIAVENHTLTGGSTCSTTSY